MERKSSDRRPVLSVIGLGKLGSPLAAVFAAKGFEVIGLDLNSETVRALNEGRAPVAEPGLRELIEASSGRLRATEDYAGAVLNSDVSFIIVPTPSGPDNMFSNRHLLRALEEIGQALQGKDTYHLVVVTSTVMPGSTEGELRASLERSSGRQIGEKLGLCYNPEFIALGSVIHDMLHPDMVLIGESDAKAGDMLETIHRQSTDSHPEIHRMNLVNAELAKLAINTFVTTKISYANMIADMCDHLAGADAAIVTRAIGTDSRIGRKYLKPAIGYGGPCFPRDNKAFVAMGRKLGVKCDLAEATDRINTHQLTRLQGAVEAVAPPGGTVAILGASYKPQTGVIEESQAVMLAQLLCASGYRVVVSDPVALPATRAVLQDTVAFEEDGAAAVARADVVVVTTPWPQFKAIPIEVFARDGRMCVVIDPWDLFDREALSKVASVIRLGSGGWKTANGAERKVA